ncbi:MAG TPA: PKD domain-containing protein, partial [Gammaproteobacteria bacterium]|nr:PKD domain-containing protein [Gammaproteobacteria bacterium]
ITSYAWSFGDGGTSTQANPGHTYTSAGDFNVTLTVTDNDGASHSDSTTSTIGGAVADCNAVDTGNLSINSTSQNGCPEQTVPESPEVLNSAYRVLAINDLGMHCGDLDTRISSILPPFQVLLGQVIQRGTTPVLNPAGIDLEYSATANPNDPILGVPGAQRGLMDDGSTYKTNFWDAVAGGAYDPFYPAAVTPLLTGPFPVAPGIGLPVPNVEDLYIGPDGVVNSGDESLTAVQHAMPGMTGPYVLNAPQTINEFYGDKPFFVNFPFGYVAEEVNWYEGTGIPFAAYDDFGRENAYPLVRVEARQGTTSVATVDTVLPISGEASCTNCHSDPTDVQNSRTSAPTDALSNAGLPVVTSLDDPDPNMPTDVSVEYAADINILRLHDLKHGADYVDTSGAPSPCDITANGGNGDASCLINKALLQGKPAVCQTCHYTPALDLAHVGPVSGPPGTDANGRNQLAHSSNSNVMHSHHGSLGNLFQPMPAPVQSANGTITNQAERLQILEDTCYQCHPGSNVQCLRGAMFNGGMLCNDCHGDMLQVGADFSQNVTPDNPAPGSLLLGGDFYDP